MASLDLIQLHGGKAANFSDLGGDAYEEKITNCFIILQKDEEVDSIYINIFCGQFFATKFVKVMLDIIDNGICTKPIVCRLKGYKSK